MFRRVCGGGAAVIVLLVLLVQLSSDSLPNERSQRPVILVTNNWASQQVFTHIVGRLIEGRGQAVAYQRSDAILQFDALARGDAHVQVAVWHNRAAEHLEAALDSGVVDAGHHALRFRDGWWVSDATLAVCPEAASWSGLVDCATRASEEGAQSVSAETEQTQPISGDTQGVFHAPPRSFERHYSDMADKLRMPFGLIPVRDFSALRETWRRFDRESELATGAPVHAVYNWSPNTFDGPVNGRFVEFPEPELACFLDPDWGPNPDVTGDCGDPLPFPVSKAAWAGLIDAYPDTWQLLQAVSFDVIDYRQVVAWMERPGAAPARVADQWIEANAERVSQWQDTL